MISITTIAQRGVRGKGGEPGIVDVIDLNSLRLVGKVEIGKQAGGIAFWKKEI